jgi:hypothetical protein
MFGFESKSLHFVPSLLGNNGLQEILDLWKYDDESGESEVISIETGPRQKMLPQNRQVASRITAPVVFLPILQVLI